MCDATTIVGIGPADNESAASETRHEAREIGIARDHPCPDLGGGQSPSPRRAENSQDVVLRQREPRGGGDRIGLFARQPCGSDERVLHLLLLIVADRHSGSSRRYRM